MPSWTKLNNTKTTKFEGKTMNRTKTDIDNEVKGLDTKQAKEVSILNAIKCYENEFPKSLNPTLALQELRNLSASSIL